MDSSTPTEPKKTDGFDDYEIKEAARTLIRAKEIQQDDKLHALACAEVQKQADAANAAVSDKKAVKTASTKLKGMKW